MHIILSPPGPPWVPAGFSCRPHALLWLKAANHSQALNQSQALPAP